MANTYMHLVRPTVAAPAAPAAASPADVLIHNLALFLILEIVSKQILEQNTRIIGTLLGVRSDDGSKVEIRDAFMVPCQETGDSISIEEHKHKALYSLYKKAHPKESVLGWFDCAGQIDASTGLIHDFYLKGADRAYPFPAIYLNVKYLNGDSIEFPTLTTYIGAALGKPGACAEDWLENRHDQHTTLTLKENSVQLHAEQLLTVSREIKTVQAHIDAVLAAIGSASHTDADIDMLRSLSNSLLNRPTILSDLDALKHHFQAHNQDIIMIEYLTRAVKEQIELSVRLSAEAEKKLA
ncbi:hypothetical protein HF325_002047 [Metschnikowia pulcherrima]|uniref:JAB1/MPN/MOV34 metalloenzyme domain-containing protein n=1 Tax=Metschnikowia pulcherrima TaxID=27326 RepID=A0A8H7LF89_9ASCO|nr:hypothetical protein HF325_002047 [Metschnikowia pulcherrima]